MTSLQEPFYSILNTLAVPISKGKNSNIVQAGVWILLHVVFLKK